MRVNLFARVLGIVTFIGFILTIVALIALPFHMMYLDDVHMMPNSRCFIWGMFIAAYVCAIPYIAALVQLKNIVKLYNNNNIFSLKTSKAFSLLSKFSFLEATLLIVILLAIRTLFYFKFSWQLMLAFFIGIFIFFTAGLICICMCQAFKQASEMKNEIELTF